MSAFVAIYSGRSITDAKIVAVTCDPELVSLVATRLLEKGHQDPDSGVDDPISEAVELGRQNALRLIACPSVAAAKTSAADWLHREDGG